MRVKEGDGARIADVGHKSYGGLAGSALTMDLGVRNLMKWLNVARVMKLAGLGVIEEGAAGDVVLWDEDLRAAMTIVGGEVVYEREVGRG